MYPTCALGWNKTCTIGLRLSYDFAQPRCKPFEEKSSLALCCQHPWPTQVIRRHTWRMLWNQYRNSRAETDKTAQTGQHRTTRRYEYKYNRKNKDKTRRDTPTYKTGFSQTDCFALRDLWQSSPLGSWGWTLRGSGSRRKFVADDSGRGEERAVQGPWWHRLPWRVVTSFDEDENLYPMKRWFWWVAPDDSVHAVL